MKSYLKYLLTGAIIAVAVIMVLFKYWDYVTNPWTRDGQVRATVIQIAPRVSAPIIDLPIRDNQFVNAGDPLFEIDPRTFQASLEQARAQLAQTGGNVEATEKQIDADKAIVTLMTYPDTPIEGEVDSLGWGIAQQDGSTGFELLPNVSPTFEWIRLAQRVPVRIHRVFEPVRASGIPPIVSRKYLTILSNVNSACFFSSKKARSSSSGNRITGPRS